MSGDRYYDGVLDGKPYKLDRMFRGRMLDLRECAALFRGRSIEVHGLRRGHTEYSVECRLEPDPVLSGIVNVRAVGTVGMNKDYRLDRETSPFRPHGLQESVVSGPNLDGGLLDQETSAGLLDDGSGPKRRGMGMYATGHVASGESLLEQDIKAVMAELSGTWAQAFGLA